MSKILFLKGVSMQELFRAPIDDQSSGCESYLIYENYLKSLLQSVNYTPDQQLKEIHRDPQLSSKTNLEGQTSTRFKLTGYQFCQIQDLDQITKQIQGQVSCFHCTLSIETPIYAIKHENFKFTIKGIFCSYVCGFSYGDGFKNITKTNLFKQLIKDYFKLQYGRILNFKNLTIDRGDYCKFGGLMNHDQFKSHIRQQELLLLQQ